MAAISDNKQNLLTTQPEKPNHYNYLKEFRVEQCSSFLQHKCNQHRPFICFYWHFQNQRRRRPVRRRDGTFNYSADNYCAKYDETTGICTDGDDCPFLHRTAGDTERRYHLRYYKTCMCVHDTDSRGYCVKNGHHCAFAHGSHDQRPPVYDIKELEAQTTESSSEGAPNALDKERNLMNEDPKWQDTNYVLANYKTEQCKRPPRLCRQGYACPQFHNSKDKRRSPRKYKYRSTPCPNVKHGEEWGEPSNCEAGDNCQYCHTRTEQQFHPEIYKSTKCNDVQQAGYCPRSVFCAFAHVEQEIPLRDGMDGPSANLALSDIISNALPNDCKLENNSLLHNGNIEGSESASTSSSVGSTSSHNKAPGSQLQQKNNLFQNNISGNNNCNSVTNNSTSNHNNYFNDFTPDLKKQILDMEQEHRKRMCLNYNLHNLGLDFYDKTANNMDELGRHDLSSMDNSISAGIAQSGLLQNSSNPVNIPSSPMANSISGLLQRTTAPVNIPSNSLGNFSPTSHTSLFPGTDPFSHMNNSAPKINNSFGPSDGLFYQSHIISPGIGDSMSNSDINSRISEINHQLRDELTNTSVGNSLFENSLQNKSSFSMSPCHQISINNSFNEIGRLREELASKNAQINTWEDQIIRATKACEAWKSELEENTRKISILEQQREEAHSHIKSLKEKIEQQNNSNQNFSNTRELRGMSLQKLKNLQTKLRSDLEEVEQVLYLETATKCMKCEENNRSVTLSPCNHYVLCEVCATNIRECPYCQTPVSSQS